MSILAITTVGPNQPKGSKILAMPKRTARFVTFSSGVSPATWNLNESSTGFQNNPKIDVLLERSCKRFHCKRLQEVPFAIFQEIKVLLFSHRWPPIDEGENGRKRIFVEFHSPSDWFRPVNGRQRLYCPYKSPREPHVHPADAYFGDNRPIASPCDSR